MSANYARLHKVIALTGLREVVTPDAGYRGQFERILLTTTSATTLAFSYTDGGEQVIVTLNIPATTVIDLDNLGFDEPTSGSKLNINVAAGTVAAVVWYTLRRPKTHPE